MKAVEILQWFGDFKFTYQLKNLLKNIDILECKSVSVQLEEFCLWAT